MARVNFGGDPESYMDPPQMSVGGSGGDGSGGSFVAGLFELLGIHRNVARGPKKGKEGRMTPKTQPSAANAIPQASDYLDQTGAALASQDAQNYRSVSIIDLPPSMVPQSEFNR